MPPRIRELARPHTTVFGKVVYKRPRHVFTEKDVYRIIRSLLDNDIEQPGAYVAGLLTSIVRISLTFFRKSHRVRQFVIDFVKKFLPDFLDNILQGAEDNYDNFLIAIWNILGSWMAGVRKSGKLTLAGQKATEEEGEDAAE